MRKKEVNNVLIRNSMKQANVFLYELADLLGVSEPTICRMLRKELPEDEQKRIVAIIEDHCRKEADTNDIQ